MRLPFTSPLTKGRSLYGDLVFVAFLIAQAIDGVFTYVGVWAFGKGIEGNPLVAWYIAAFGAGVALIAAKTVAVGCATVLHLRSMHQTIGVLTLLYFTMAIVPWTRLLWE